MAEAVRRRRQRAVVLGVPAAFVALLAVIALMRIGGPSREEPGAAGTMGINTDRDVSIERIEVRQLTSDRTFWAGEIDESPVFVVSEQPIRLEPGTYVAIAGRLRPALSVEAAQKAWHVNEATARAVQEHGSYLRATSIAPARDR